MNNIRRMVHLMASADGSQLRTAELNGIQYIVCPTVSKLGDSVEWPINSPIPVFIPASTLSLMTHSRNNRPVVMDHPKIGAEYVSANDPAILEKYCYGFVFNASFEDNRVKCEIWLDPEKAKAVGPEAERVIERLRKGETIEVSEGDYAIWENETGEFNGKKYGAKWIACWADHLATLPEGAKGACSISDGCGALRAAKGYSEPPSLFIASSDDDASFSASALAQARRPSFNGTETTSWTRPSFADYIRYLYNGDSPPTSVAQCSSDLKRAIASHTLLGDPDASNFSDLTLFPVVNPATAYLNENALRLVLSGRGSSNTPESALASAQEMARRLLNSEFSANLPAKETKASAASAAFSTTTTSTTSTTSAAKGSKPMNRFKKLLSSVLSSPGSIHNGRSNNEIRGKLYEALGEVEPGLYRVEDEDLETEIVIYCTRVIYDVYDYKSELFWWQRGFSIDVSGNITLADDRVQVEPAMIWKPFDSSSETNGGSSNGSGAETLATATAASQSTSAPCSCHSKSSHATFSTEGDISMPLDRNAVLKRLSALSQFSSQTDATRLAACSDETLEMLDKAFPEAAPAPAPASSPVAVASPDPDVIPISRAEYEDIKASATAFKAQQAQHKSSLIASLKAAQVEFTEPELEAMQILQLEKLSRTLKIDQPVAASATHYMGLPIPRESSNAAPKMRDLPDTWGLRAASEKSN